MSTNEQTMEKIVALCRRRGFIFGSSEIYGGIGGFWDYGPLGTELKRNIKDAWWNDMVRNPPPGPDGVRYQIVGVDCSIIMNPKVWEASGHVGGFSDPMVDCTQCKKRFRADQLWSVQVYPPGVFPNHNRYLSGEARGFGYSITVELAKKGPGWIASKVFDDVDQALEGVEELIRHSGKKAGVRELKSFTLGRTATYEDRGLFEGKTSEGTSFNGVIQPVPRGTLAPEEITSRPCPECFGRLTEIRQFNLMFESHAGAVRDEASKVYLRPETAQGIFVNFKNVLDSTRVKVPFGIAQIGKAFRNEINPRNFTFRSREFEQMEMEFFCHESEAAKWYKHWRDIRYAWYISLGLKSDRLRLREHDADELAHYAKGCADIEYLFPFSNEPQELEGIAHRGNFDLTQHGKHARGKEMAFAVVDDVTKERYVPHVIEPSAGVDRFALAVICEAYTFDKDRASPEFMKFHPRLAPIKAAVFPLVAKDGMPDIAEPIYRDIQKRLPCQYDAKQSIGKRYARMDEAGTPFCFTIDGQTKEDGTVTVRDRDDASQVRIDKSRCLEYLQDKLGLA
ncbi:MAG: glycine--tRNA ligase [Planctomycetes bacterium]|nr:glycine--tRNA ligase [Planctomycetota bacterium]